MKRIPAARRVLLARLAQRRHEHELKRACRKYAGETEIRLPHSVGGRIEYVDRVPPEAMCLETNFDETSGFLQELRTCANGTKKPIRLRLENCRKMSPSAMLLFLAEIHRARLHRGVKAITGTYPRDQALLRRMCHMGFFTLLGVRSPIEASRTFPMEYIRFRSGTKLHETGARELRESMFGEKIVFHSMARKRLQRAVTEAMLNAVNHAYPPDKRQRDMQGRWWLCGHYHRPTRKLSVIFCDLGVGIPATLPKRYAWEKIRYALSVLPHVRPNDGQMILAGMTIGRTRTHQEGRGKGLNDLRRFIEDTSAGEMIIYSRQGSYKYNSEGEEVSSNLSNRVAGTLIHWMVPIHKITSWTGETENDHAATDYGSD